MDLVIDSITYLEIIAQINPGTQEKTAIAIIDKD